MRVLLLLLLYFLVGPTQAQVFDRLYPDSEAVVLAHPLKWIAVPKGSIFSPDQLVAEHGAGFEPYTEQTVLPTSDRLEAWASFALPAAEPPRVWFIRIPRQTIVKVSLFVRNIHGDWQVESAGESIAPSKWALATRVPSFQLQTRSDREQHYFLRFEHRSPVTERPMLVTPIEYVNGASRVGIVMGLVFGMFTLLAILCVSAYAFARNTVFLWFGAFIVTLMFTQLILIGFGSWRLWPNSSYLHQVMAWVSTALSLASGAWFCARASYAKSSHPWIYRLLAVVALVSLLLAVVMLANQDLLPRSVRNLWTAFATLAVIASLVWMSLRGQTWNLLLLLGAAPIGVAAINRLFYNVGWLSHIEAAQAAGALLAQVGLIWILLALAWRNRSSLLSREHRAALATYDASTGLLLPGVVDSRLPRMLLRASRQKSECGVMMLRWLDHTPADITWRAEQRSAALLRLGSNLRRVARDVDTAVRFSEDHFLIMVEGPITRTAMSDIATQILASCIRSGDKLGDPNALNLHIAIWHDQPGSQTSRQVIETLQTRLHQMAAGTKRPVQFVDAVSEYLPNASDEAERREDLVAKINKIESNAATLAHERSV